MTAADRRMEIVSILVVSRYFTSKELAQEFGVCVQTIRNDITVFSYGYPIYTKPGAGGGIFIVEGYKPYNNTLTSYEQENSKKCMMQRREKIKNLGTCSLKIWGLQVETLGQAYQKLNI